MKKYQSIPEVIEQCVNDISLDIASLQYVKNIDFLDIFPKSPEHKTLLDKEALKISSIVEKTERGNFYVLYEPISTKFGNLKIFKIRKYDETRLPWVAAPDFTMISYDQFLAEYKNDPRFTYIIKPTYTGLEFKTSSSLIYFLDVPTTEYYHIQ